MDKHFADRTIIKFQKIFFGFALSKTTDVKEAEELASRILLEAYTALLKTEGVENWDGYLYRIAHHVFARYLNEKNKNLTLCIDEMEIPFDKDFTFEVEQSEQYKQLKREVAYLGNLQRNIVVMHYYQNLKIDEIANKLSLSTGTVKWHLHDARKQLKEGINSMRTMGDLGVAPIMLCSMGHSGMSGAPGDTSYYLNSKLKQNIAYAAYDQPRTVQEIAEELGITPVYVEDEVNYLEEYGFLDRLSGRNYRTNIFISRSSKECEVEKFKLLQKLAGKVCDLYVPLLIEAMEKLDYNEIYLPNHDQNLFLWSLLPYVMGYKISEEGYNQSLKGTNYLVKRKDGGEYIAFATLRQDIDMGHGDHYHVCGNMTRSSLSYPIASWQISTCFDLRTGGWQDNRTEDLEYLYQFIQGKLPKEEVLADKYARMYERGLIANHAGNDQVNVAIVRTSPKDGDIYPTKNEFIEKLPDIPKALLDEMKEIDAALYELQKPYYPEHMHKLLKAWNMNTLGRNEIRIMVLDQLLMRGILKEPTEIHKKGLTTIVFADILP